MTYLDEVRTLSACMEARVEASRNKKGWNLEIDVLQGTLGKAFGAMGGYIAASDAICDAVRGYGSGFIFTTAMPPALAAAALTSVQHLRQSQIERNAQQRQSKQLKKRLYEYGMPFLTGNTHIVPVMVGDAASARKLVKFCLRNMDFTFNL